MINKGKTELLQTTSSYLAAKGNHKTETVQTWMVSYRDPVTKKFFQFITNVYNLAFMTISNFYGNRWQIETFLKESNKITRCCIFWEILKTPLKFKSGVL